MCNGIRAHLFVIFAITFVGRFRQDLLWCGRLWLRGIVLAQMNDDIHIRTGLWTLPVAVSLHVANGSLVWKYSRISAAFGSTCGKQKIADPSTFCSALAMPKASHGSWFSKNRIEIPTLHFFIPTGKYNSFRIGTELFTVTALAILHIIFVVIQGWWCLIGIKAKHSYSIHY